MQAIIWKDERTDHHLLCKRCSKWVPHKLIDGQEDRWVDWCRLMIEKMDGGEKTTYAPYLPTTKYGCTTTTPKQRQLMIWYFENENQHQQNVVERNAHNKWSFVKPVILLLWC
ncbi:hypothetical protein EVAR_62869_1 [Eumeta japonica]|uniref:Uncharacterized protein n=1 Tax=Eumeta variegata TaxID=151549 RepID=A0A4C1Z486_EUMVA|nr:hypothetical protein EVAR_62869_1 [Eumeta japonica]